MLCILWCYIFIIPVLYAGSSPQNEKALNKTAVVKGFQKDIYNKTTFTLVSEGGSISPDTPLTLPKEYEILSNLDDEIGTKKEKPIARRNGVGLPSSEDKSSNTSVDLQTKQIAPEPIKNFTLTSNSVKNTTELNKELSHIQLSNNKEKNVTISSNTVVQNSPQVNKILLKNKTSEQNFTEGLNKTKIYKPLVLSYEALPDPDDKNQITITSVKSSSKTIVNDQIPSPNKDKVSTMSSNKHPGMIMPLVITILVVPMFAVLGFMALRRGREAWKNRHYKRMDFLLDGMYND